MCKLLDIFAQLYQTKGCWDEAIRCHQLRPLQSSQVIHSQVRRPCRRKIQEFFCIKKGGLHGYHGGEMLDFMDKCDKWQYGLYMICGLERDII